MAFSHQFQINFHDSSSSHEYIFSRDHDPRCDLPWPLPYRDPALQFSDPSWTTDTRLINSFDNISSDPRKGLSMPTYFTLKFMYFQFNPYLCHVNLQWFCLFPRTPSSTLLLNTWFHLSSTVTRLTPGQTIQFPSIFYPFSCFIYLTLNTPCSSQ